MVTTYHHYDKASPIEESERVTIVGHNHSYLTEEELFDIGESLGDTDISLIRAFLLKIDGHKRLSTSIFRGEHNAFNSANSYLKVALESGEHILEISTLEANTRTDSSTTKKFRITLEAGKTYSIAALRSQNQCIQEFTAKKCIYTWMPVVMNLTDRKTNLIIGEKIIPFPIPKKENLGGSSV